ncbi:probable salivary secreted peptide [Solenopsis invicta]|uniref:probable salivary secreted peptide n=1 Tax=Solenopsis invicta TaxID=13686 RepID=UPI00193E2697|nr:probable salivary secreted peptide [Solenopsis invicta]
MSAHKYIIGLIVLIAGLLTVNSIPTNGNNILEDNEGDVVPYESHNLIVGIRSPGDRLSYTENIVKDSSWLRIVTIEKTFFVPQGERITMLEALDQKTNGNGAHASILNGGPGNNNVTLKFKSQRSHGINFVVKLYSRF